MEMEPETPQINYGLPKSKEEPFTAGVPIDLLPRAVLRRNATLLLDGDWHFELDPEDRGLREHWHLGHPYAEMTRWPGSVEDHMRSAHGAFPDKLEKVIAWYEREFPLPDLESLSQKSMLQLTFGACGYETRVWLNGFPLTTVEGESVHFGEYTSFSYELEPHILKSANRLTVRIADSMEPDIPRGKQASHIYKRGGIWYHAYSGPVRSVWLEEVERNRLRSRVSVVSNVEERLVSFGLTLHIHDPGVYTVRLQVSMPGDTPGVILAEDWYTLALEAGERNQCLVLHIPGAALWSFDQPHLYKLTATLADEEGYRAMIETLFGLRKIESRGSQVFLNNDRVYLDGVLYQPGTSTYEEIKKHLYAIRRLGCNLVRIHITGVDPRIYKLADKIGLLLWVEVPSPHRSNQVSRSNHNQELLRMLRLLGTHPSIVIWSLYNEGWGAQDLAGNRETRQYITGLYDYMRIHHPQFLIVDNDGWSHISNEGRLKSDLLTAHIYTPGFHKWTRALDDITEGRMAKPEPLVVGDPFFYRHQLPVIISEWGGFGFKNYGGPSDNAGRNRLIRKFKAELRKREIAGDVYTQAIGIEEEQNGLVDNATGDLLVDEGLLGSGNLSLTSGGRRAPSASGRNIQTDRASPESELE